MTDERLIVLVIIRCHVAERRMPGGLALRVREQYQAELRRRYARGEDRGTIYRARTAVLELTGADLSAEEDESAVLYLETAERRTARL